MDNNLWDSEHVRAKCYLVRLVTLKLHVTLHNERQQQCVNISTNICTEK